MNTSATTVSEASAATKACPYCGEQILAVAVKCKHCGSVLNNGMSSAAEVVGNQLRLRPSFAVLLVVIVAVLGTAWVYNFDRTGSISGKGFSDADVATIEQSIRTELGKRGATVEDVKLIRQSPRQLTGFAKLHVPVLGTVSKTCTATMGDNGQSIWRCQ